MLRDDDMHFTRKYHKYNPEVAEVFAITTRGHTAKELVEGVMSSASVSGVKELVHPAIKEDLVTIVNACQDIYKKLGDDSPRGAINTLSVAYLAAQISLVANAPDGAGGIEALNVIFLIQALSSFPDKVWQDITTYLPTDGRGEYGDMLRDAVYKYNCAVGGMMK